MVKKTRFCALAFLTMLAVVCLLIPLAAHAQNVLTNDKALENINGYVAVVPNATITVCTSTATGTPCSPKASVCVSATDTTCSSPNPFSADANGNYSFWEPPGTYIVSITGSGISGGNITYTVPCATGTSCGSGGASNLTSLSGGTAASGQTYDFAAHSTVVRVTTPALNDNSTNAVNSSWVVQYLNTPGYAGTIYPTQIGDATHGVGLYGSFLSINSPAFFWYGTGDGTCSLQGAATGGLINIGTNGVPAGWNVNYGGCQDFATWDSTPVAGNLVIAGSDYPGQKTAPTTFAQCTGGQVPTGISANGNANGCFTPSGSGTTTDGAGTTTGNEILVSTTTAHAYTDVATLPAAAMPGFTGDATSTAGTRTLAVGKVNGAAIPASQPCLGSNSSSQFISGTCSGGSSGGAVIYTSNQTASSSDNGKTVVLGSVNYTLPSTQPSSSWCTFVIAESGASPILVLGGSDTYNGGTTLPILNPYTPIKICSDPGTSTNYIGQENSGYKHFNYFIATPNYADPYTSFYTTAPITITRVTAVALTTAPVGCTTTYQFGVFAGTISAGVVTTYSQLSGAVATMSDASSSGQNVFADSGVISVPVPAGALAVGVWRVGTGSCTSTATGVALDVEYQ